MYCSSNAFHLQEEDKRRRRLSCHNYYLFARYLKLPFIGYVASVGWGFYYILRYIHYLDSAEVESFSHSLKTERVKRKSYEGRNTARADLFNYIEMFYNRKRLYSHLSHVSHG